MRGRGVQGAQCLLSVPHQVWQTPRAGKWGPRQAHCGREDGAEEVSAVVALVAALREGCVVPAVLLGVHVGFSWHLILFVCIFPLAAAPSPPSWGPGWTSTQRISASPPTSPASSSSSPTCATTSPAPTWSAEPASCWPSSSSKSRARPRQKVGSSPRLWGHLGLQVEGMLLVGIEGPQNLSHVAEQP